MFLKKIAKFLGFGEKIVKEKASTPVRKSLSIEDFLYHDVVITPYVTPSAHFNWFPSLIGNVSVDKEYVGHFQFHGKTSYKCFPKEYTHVYETPCIYCGYLFSGYGHFILESLAMYYCIKQLPPNYKLVFSYSNNKDIQSCYKDILTFKHSKQLIDYQVDVFYNLGITNEIEIIKEPTLFKEIYVPPAGFALGRWFIKEQQEALELIESKPEKGKYIYLSRYQYNSMRGARNENEIHDFLASRGWEIVYPERLSFKEQLEKIASAEIIFGITGSALHNLIFIKNIKNRFIVIDRGHTETYNIIAAAKQAKDYYIIDVPKKSLTPDVQSSLDETFLLDIDFVKDQVIQSNDFCDLSKINSLKRPDKPESEFEYLSENLFGPDSRPAYEIDDLIYEILISEKTDPQHCIQLITKCISSNLLTDNYVESIFRVAERIDPQFSLHVLEQGLNKFKKHAHRAYLYNVLTDTFVRVHGINPNQDRTILYRETALYEESKGNDFIALELLNLSLQNGGDICSRGTITEIYNKLNLHDVAIKFAEETIKTNNQMSWAYTHLAISYFYTKDYEKAYKAIEKACHLDKNDEWTESWRKKINKKYKKNKKI